MQPIRALYVHVPFCQTICGYCDFYSVTFDRDAVHPLIDALLAELHEPANAEKRFEMRSIFVGGGTPTTLPPPELERLLSALRQFATSRENPAPELEYTVEANPATVSRDTASAMVRSGVNRVSIGAQSFSPTELKVLDRIHRPAQVAETVEICRSAGIRQLNLDLIFAVPGQSLESWLGNLRTAIALEPDHVSCYGLTYERGTPLFEQLAAGRVRRADAELEAEMYEATIDTLSRAGYEQYEISNFARPGCACRHNLVYWNNDSYLGIGPSASGYVDGVRYKNIPDRAEYSRAIRNGKLPRIQQERLEPDQRARESAMLELRLNRGIDRQQFLTRTGVDPAVFFDAAVRKHRELGMLEVDPGFIRLTRRGRLVADSVAADFL